jgi:hypothetical protein
MSADHATPLYPQKWVLTSPTSGGRSVGIVRSRTKATELVSLFLWIVGSSPLDNAGYLTTCEHTILCFTTQLSFKEIQNA